MKFQTKERKDPESTHVIQREEKGGGHGQGGEGGGRNRGGEGGREKEAGRERKQVIEKGNTIG